IYYNEDLEKTIKDFIVKGGKIIGSYDSCFPKKNRDNIYGIKYIGESEYYREFVMPNKVIGKDFLEEELVMYLRGYDVETKDGQVIMDKIKPYFDRKGVKFCSHQHAPSSGEIGYPEVIRKNNVIYFSHPI